MDLITFLNIKSPRVAATEYRKLLINTKKYEDFDKKMVWNPDRNICRWEIFKSYGFIDGYLFSLNESNHISQIDHYHFREELQEICKDFIVCFDVR